MASNFEGLSFLEILVGNIDYEISIREVYESEEDIDAFYESHEIESGMFESAPLFRTIPASKSSIEALKEVKVDHDLGGKTLEQCSICLENLSFEKFNNDIDDSKRVLLMPCSHLFHKDCIVRWLETSHMCPLCRSAMPT